jgi:hypothetical protein
MRFHRQPGLLHVGGHLAGICDRTGMVVGPMHDDHPAGAPQLPHGIQVLRVTDKPQRLTGRGASG